MNYDKLERARQYLILAVAHTLDISSTEVIQDTKLIAWVFKTANEMERLEKGL